MKHMKFMAATALAAVAWQAGPAVATSAKHETVRAYRACKEKELDRFEAQISPLEYSWFLQAD